MTTTKAINVALRTLGVAGLAGVTVVAPNALQGLGFLLKRSPARKVNHQTILNELRRQGLVHIIQNDKSLTYTLTPAGIHRLQRVMIDNVDIPVPAQWDKKWRLVTFDIPVQFSKQRSYFTSRLQGLGFVMLQRSMWAYPFPCFDQVEQVAGYYNVLRYCTLMEVSLLDDLSTRRLVKRFAHLL